MSKLLLASLCLVAGAALAQAPNPADKEERPSKPAPRLNLKLDNPAQYSREEPRTDAETANLPTLGGNAQKLDTTPLRHPDTTRNNNTAYPLDAQAPRER